MYLQIQMRLNNVMSCLKMMKKSDYQELPSYLSYLEVLEEPSLLESSVYSTVESTRVYSSLLESTQSTR